MKSEKLMMAELKHLRKENERLEKENEFLDWQMRHHDAKVVKLIKQLNKAERRARRLLISYRQKHWSRVENHIECLIEILRIHIL
jgi:cell division septum initiation protein DivIVA